MIDVILSIQAEEDLSGIWVYSYEAWGESQADLYLDRLRKAIQALAENPKIGVDISHIQAGYRRLNVERHGVYYALTPTVVTVVRVLHERMDADNRL